MGRRGTPGKEEAERETVRPSSLSILGQAPVPVERADAARNRAKILEAARKLLGRRRIDEICMDELADAAGVGKGTLYRRFVDRSSLCHALLDDNEKQLQARVLKRFDLPPQTGALTRLRVLLTALFVHVVENAALLAEARAFERGGEAPRDHPVMVWRRAELCRLFNQLIAEGQATAQDTVLTADFILSALDADLIRAQLARGVPEDTLRDAFISFCLRSAGIHTP